MIRKTFIVGLLACGCTTAHANAYPGDLDGAVGDRGVVTGPPGLSTRPVAADPGGGFLLGAGGVIRRYLSNGTPDPAFGSGGDATSASGSLRPHP